eukprot:2589899-Pyramimonas_sp.AAC.1
MWALKSAIGPTFAQVRYSNNSDIHLIASRRGRLVPLQVKRVKSQRSPQHCQQSYPRHTAVVCELSTGRDAFDGSSDDFALLVILNVLDVNVVMPLWSFHRTKANAMSRWICAVVPIFCCIPLFVYCELVVIYELTDTHSNINASLVYATAAHITEQTAKRLEE